MFFNGRNRQVKVDKRRVLDLVRLNIFKLDTYNVIFLKVKMINSYDRLLKS